MELHHEAKAEIVAVIVRSVQSDVFAVNILAADQEETSRRFASADMDRFKDLDIDKGLGGLSLILGAMAWIECATEDRLPGGDHTIIVGRVLRARSFPLAPLLHWRGDYLAVGDDVLARPVVTGSQKPPSEPLRGRFEKG